VHAVEAAAADGAAQPLQRLRGDGAYLGRGLHAPGEAAREVGVLLRRGEAVEATEHAPEVEQRLVRVRRQPCAQLGLRGAEVEVLRLERAQLAGPQLQRRARLVDVAEPLEELGLRGAGRARVSSGRAWGVRSAGGSSLAWHTASVRSWQSCSPACSWTKKSGHASGGHAAALGKARRR